jgi:SAM-dependent methyltransferase
MTVDSLYQIRFNCERHLQNKDRIWKVLCQAFFQQFIKPTDVVVDIGAGYCEFINNISAGRKIAIDLNRDTTTFAAAGVEVINEPYHSISALPPESVDVFFISNFLEHLDSKDQVLALLKECKRPLRRGGKILILQPNIRLIGGAYWDFIDHKIPLTEKSLTEAAELSGLKVELLIPRFLPYTTKNRFPQNPWLVRLYLLLKPAWFIFGKQSFIILSATTDC